MFSTCAPARALLHTAGPESAAVRLLPRLCPCTAGRAYAYYAYSLLQGSPVLRRTVAALCSNQVPAVGNEVGAPRPKFFGKPVQARSLPQLSADMSFEVGPLVLATSRCPIRG